MAVGCENGYVTIWDTKTNSKTYNCQLHSQPVTGINLSRCGNFLISSGKDHKICVTDLNSGECQFRINLTVPINTVDLNFDDKIIGVGLDDGSVYLYDLNYAVQPLSCLRQHNYPVNILKFANYPKDLIENESSISTVTTVQDNISEMRMTSPKTGLTNYSENLNGVKKELMQSMKGQTEDLENQLGEHCKKFQSFINNEVFASGDFGKLFQDANSDFCDVDRM